MFSREFVFIFPARSYALCCALLKCSDQCRNFKLFLGFVVFPGGNLSAIKKVFELAAVSSFLTLCLQKDGVFQPRTVDIFHIYP